MSAELLIHGIPVAFRTFEASDRAYVEDSWNRSAYDSAKKPQPFFRWSRPLIAQHVNLDTVRVACHQDDPSILFGWCCFRNGLPIYGYTAGSKDVSFRKQGLMRALSGYQE